jgi:hypothetical protein
MKPNMSTLFSIHLPISVAILVPIRNAKWLPVEIRSYQQTKLEKNSTADIMSWLTASR